jgi:hypothetical protein
VHPHPVRQPGVDKRDRIVESPANRGSQALGEPAYFMVIVELERRELQSGTTIDEHLTRAVDQYIGDPGLTKQRL